MVMLLRLFAVLSVVGALFAGFMAAPPITDRTAMTEACAKRGPVPGLITRECEDAADSAVSRSRGAAAQIWATALGSGLVGVVLFLATAEVLVRTRRTDEAVADLAHRFDELRRQR